jgi:hypothetical protein
MSYRLIQCWCLICCCLVGCESLTPRPAPVTVVAPTTNSPVDPYLALSATLSDGDPAHQSDVFYEIEKSYTQAPTTMNALRYAIAFAVPGHPHSDPVQAKKLLEQLLANPERVSNAEHSIAVTMLNVADEWLKLQADNRRLVATVDDKSHNQANLERRAQSQVDEISKLRKALDAAQQKLDAIRDIERSISERSTPPSGTRDSTNRDSASQTQTPPVSR